MKKIIALFIIMFLFTSCMENAFDGIVFRTTEDPFDDIPEVDSLSLEKTIYVKWREDEGCDCFYLQRAVDQKNLVFECVYKGSQTSYTDTDLKENTRYIYRLDKQRGSEIFTGENLSYAFCSEVRRDSCEDNDLEDNAYFLEYDLICNLPCVKYITGSLTVIDTDWFYVSVPPMRTAEILVNQTGLKNSNTGTKTQLFFQQKENSMSAISQNIGIEITNPTYKTENLYFKIFPDTTALFSEDDYTTTIEYKVSLNKIYKYE